MSVLLKRLTGWMAEAAVYLQRCHMAKHQGSAASVASLEGLDVRQDLGSIAEARQALQVGCHLASCHMTVIAMTFFRCGFVHSQCR